MQFTRTRTMSARAYPSLSKLSIALTAILASVLLPATSPAQLTKAESKCVRTLNKDAAKLGKAQSKLQQKCLKDGAKGKLPGTVQQCIDDDSKGKISGSEQKTLADELKSCADGSGFVAASGAQANLSGKAETIELFHTLVGSSPDAAIQNEKAEIKCQQKVQKALDKVLATESKVFAKCLKSALALATDLGPVEACLDSLLTDEKVGKSVAKLKDLRAKRCEALTLNTIFPGDCALVDPIQFDSCTEAAARCRACTSLGGINGLSTDCDLHDNGLDDASCADVAPSCGDGNVDAGEECDPASEPTCCSATCTANFDGLSCDDGVFCNGIDTCAAGACVHPGDPCAGGAECNVTCNEGAGNCLDPNGTLCTSDGNECTDNICDGLGNCTHPGNFSPCTDDGNVCTDDVCNGVGVCTHPNNSAPCDDSDACTTVDVCGGGTCNGSVPPNCNDSNVCTTDSCDTGSGCQNIPNSLPCDDFLYCNGTDTCSGGSCSVHSGDPCSGGTQCNNSCQEGPDTCFSTAGTTCDIAPPGQNDPCDDTTDTCNGSGTCQRNDPAFSQELCYVAGDEDCDGAADADDLGTNSLCRVGSGTATETCSCSEACLIGRIIPVVGSAVSLNGMSTLAVGGSVSTTSSSSYDSASGQTFTYSFASKPSNLSVWWGLTGANGQQARFNGHKLNLTATNPAVDAHDSTTSCFSGGCTHRQLDVADFCNVDNNWCGDPPDVDHCQFFEAFGSTDFQLALNYSGGALQSIGWSEPVHYNGTAFEWANTYGTYATEVESNLWNHTQMFPVTGNFAMRVSINAFDGGLKSNFDACEFRSNAGYGINVQGALWGSYRDANVCPE